MNETWSRVLWSQFGAAIDMLHDAIVASPPALWERPMWREGTQPAEYSQVWNIAYHALFWLDLYLSGSPEGFAPPAPFGLDELDPRGALPDRPYTLDEMLGYLAHCRDKCRRITSQLSEARAREICTLTWGQPSFLELQLYNMRHVQEHAAQIALLLGQEAGYAPRWIAYARGDRQG